MAARLALQFFRQWLSEGHGLLPWAPFAKGSRLDKVRKFKGLTPSGAQEASSKNS